MNGKEGDEGSVTDPGSTAAVNSAANCINFLSASPFLLGIGSSHYFQGSVREWWDGEMGSIDMSG